MSDFRFPIGTRVRYKRTGEVGVVVDYKRLAGENYYIVDIAGEENTLPERDLEQARDIFDRLAAQERLGYPTDFDLVVRSTALMAALGQRGMSCLTNARLSAKPHQVFVAHRVLQDLYPRFILADEVGLGKTIEAGLILKELKARGLAERILIVTPASLCEQWRGELATKFNERFVVYNGVRIRDNLDQQPDQNPWGRDPFVITSLQFARGQCSTVHRPPRQRKDEGRGNRWIDEVEWDLVIFDEAHHLRRYLKNSSGVTEEREITQSYRLAQALEERTRSLLLLTATPLQTSQYDAYSLIELVDPYLFRNFRDFQEYLDRTARQEWRKIATFSRTLAQAVGHVPTEGLIRQFDEVIKASLHFRTYEDLWSTLFAVVSPSAPLRPGGKISLAQVQRCYDYVYHLKKQRAHRLPPENNDPLLSAIRTSGGQNRRAPLDLLRHEGLPELLIAARETLQDWISRQHQLSRVMIRNRKREALKGELIDRQATLLPVQLTEPELTLYEDVSAYIRHSYSQLLARTTGKRTAVGFILTTFRKLLVSSRSALAASLEKRAARLEEAMRRGRLADDPLDEDEAEEIEELVDTSEDLENLLNLTASASRADVQAEILTLREFARVARRIPVDSKAEALRACVTKVLATDSTEKLLIFTQFRETQRYLHELLRGLGYQIALFHGEESGSAYSKRAEFERFKRDPAVRIMIATDVGGEGLNLQFCRNLINYDLPWNPMNIEQRIGRIDRIGQQRGVRIFNFALEGTLDGRILHVLQERVRIFEQTIGVLDPIIGEEIERAIKDIAFQSDTYKQLIPVVVDRSGAYDEARTRRIFELQADERAAQSTRHAFSADELRQLQAAARKALDRIAERVLIENERRHREELEELRGRQKQIFAFRLQRLNDELARRQGQLSDARKQRQEPRIRLLEGQVAATVRRIKELEVQQAEDQERIRERHTFHQRIERLSVAVVYIQPRSRG